MNTEQFGDPNERRDNLSDLAGGFRQAAVILAANELGVFHELSIGPQDMVSLCERLEVSERGLDALLNALVALELLSCRDGLYALHGDGLEFLKDGAAYYLGDIFRHNFRLMKKWANLDEAVRTGLPVSSSSALDGRSEEDLEAFILGMENISRTSASVVADSLYLKGVKRILDVGGGPGTYLITFLKKLKDSQGALLDFPPVVAIAREQVQEAGLEKRISFIEGDMFEADFQGPYDLIFLGNIIHSHGEKENRKLMKKCAAALNRGGLLVIKDFFLDSTATRPLYAALFSLNMLSGTEEGRSYRWEDAAAFVRNARLQVVQRIQVGRHSGVLVAEKK